MVGDTRGHQRAEHGAQNCRAHDPQAPNLQLCIHAQVCVLDRLAAFRSASISNGSYHPLNDKQGVGDESR